VNQDDLFEEIEFISPWTEGTTTTTKLRRDLLNELRGGPVSDIDDLDAAIALTQPVWNDLIAYGTGGGNVLDDKELMLAQRALTATLSRIGITLTIPWRDFTTFRSHWVRNGSPTRGRPAATCWRICSLRCRRSWIGRRTRSSAL
jgi:hypothetical protein